MDLAFDFLKGRGTTLEDLPIMDVEEYGIPKGVRYVSRMHDKTPLEAQPLSQRDFEYEEEHEENPNLEALQGIYESNQPPGSWWINPDLESLSRMRTDALQNDLNVYGLATMQDMSQKLQADKRFERLHEGYLYDDLEPDETFRLDLPSDVNMGNIRTAARHGLNEGMDMGYPLPDITSNQQRILGTLEGAGIEPPMPHFVDAFTGRKVASKPMDLAMRLLKNEDWDEWNQHRNFLMDILAQKYRQRMFDEGTPDKAMSRLGGPPMYSDAGLEDWGAIPKRYDLKRWQRDYGHLLPEEKIQQYADPDYKGPWDVPQEMGTIPFDSPEWNELREKLGPKPVMTGEPMDLAFRLLKINMGDIEAWERWADRDMSGKETRRTTPTGRKKMRSMGSGQESVGAGGHGGYRGQPSEDMEEEWDKMKVHPGSLGHIEHMRQEMQERDNPWIDGTEFSLPSKAWPFASPPFIPEREYTTHEDLQDYSFPQGLRFSSITPDDPAYKVFYGEDEDDEIEENDDRKMTHYPVKNTWEGPMIEDDVPSFVGTPMNPLTGFHRSEPMDIAMRLLKDRKSPEAFQHKKEYDTKYESSPERIKYREQLNQERRKRGMYGDHSHRDISHTQGDKLSIEDEHSNRARHFKQRGTLRNA